MTVENQITESGKHHEKEPESDMKGGNNQTENVDQIEQWHNRRNQYKSEHTSNPEQEPCDNEEEDEDIPENEEDSICRTNKYKVFATSFLLLIGHQIVSAKPIVNIIIYLPCYISIKINKSFY